MTETEKVPIIPWERLRDRIIAEDDPEVLRKDYGIGDGFAFLFNTDRPQEMRLEQMLETYPKIDDFESIFKYDRTKRYMIGDVCLVYRTWRYDDFASVFERKSGRKIETNSCLSFHPRVEDQYGQGVLITKDAVLDVSNKIMKADIPFATWSPPSVYIPK